MRTLKNDDFKLSAFCPVSAHMSFSLFLIFFVNSYSIIMLLWKGDALEIRCRMMPNIDVFAVLVKRNDIKTSIT